MASYSEVTAALLSAAKAREDALPIRNDQCRSQLLLQPTKPAKVCLLFHGFTTGSCQLQPIATALFEAGYSVLVPRMPGHGLAGTWWLDQPPPLPTQAENYQRFALSWLQQAQALGDRVIVGGIGSGGTLAAWLAGERAEAIDRALLFAPYLKSSGEVVDAYVRRLGAYCEWVGADPRYACFGYEGFLRPALEVFLQLGGELVDRVRSRPSVPFLLVSSHNATVAEQHDLFEAALQQPKSWFYRFDGILEIPPALLSPNDVLRSFGNRSQNLLATLTKAFIESDLAWAEVQQIGDRIAAGESVEAAIGKLNLGQRASPDLPALTGLWDRSPSP